MDDYYDEKSSDALMGDDELFENEVIRQDEDLLLMDVFLKEVFRTK